MDRIAHEMNRRSWNAATVAHNRHKGDQAAALAAGQSTLFPDELALLGPVHGADLVHLQCNAGQDSLSLAALGARVTGVDISDEAIAFANQLSSKSGVPARFVRADVLDWLAETEDRFDLAFASYGAIGWLSDLDAYARGIARVVRPGGRYVLMEFHPAVWGLGDDGVTRQAWLLGGESLEEPLGVADYVAAAAGGLGEVADVAPFVNPHPTREFGWSTADIIQALIDAGLTLERFIEVPYSNGWRPFAEMVALPGRRWAATPQLPLMFGVAARKPG